eukprot:TRINITY_DN1484_c0_g4_i2.p1 TRINITY_DN1484_c0_g4~~TRINITY_DN1484_c0_g4_i2.p1  ORF type:complete len:302 (-),score=49.51 TRINITY_DN1484_c0_g4_i2:326-1183(-)
MGNETSFVQELGLHLERPINSADFDALWKKYCDDKKSSLTYEEAKKFLKHMAEAFGIAYSDQKALELIKQCDVERKGHLTKTMFTALFFELAKDSGKKVDTSLSINASHGQLLEQLWKSRWESMVNDKEIEVEEQGSGNLNMNRTIRNKTNGAIVFLGWKNETEGTAKISTSFITFDGKSLECVKKRILPHTGSGVGGTNGTSGSGSGSGIGGSVEDLSICIKFNQNTFIIFNSSTCQYEKIDKDVHLEAEKWRDELLKVLNIPQKRENFEFFCEHFNLRQLKFN